MEPNSDQICQLVWWATLASVVVTLASVLRWFWPNLENSENMVGQKLPIIGVKIQAPADSVSCKGQK